MIWKIKKPVDPELVIKTRFAIFPKRIGDYKVWLQKYYIKKSGKTTNWAFIANRTRYKFSSIGKTVFLTKEDCLAAINTKKAKNYKQHIL